MGTIKFHKKTHSVFEIGIIERKIVPKAKINCILDNQHGSICYGMYANNNGHGHVILDAHDGFKGTKSTFDKDKIEIEVNKDNIIRMELDIHHKTLKFII